MECAPNIKAQIEMGTVHSADVSGLAQARYLHLFKYIHTLEVITNNLSLRF